MRNESAITAAMAATPSGPRRTRLVLAGLLVAVLGAMIPLWTQDMPFVLVMASHAAVAAILAISLDMLMGNVGLLSFGHAGWFGLGAYIAGLSAKLVSTEILLVVPLALIFALVLSMAVGMILVRQVGTAFAILTLAFSQVLYALVFLFSDMTGGEDGLQGIPIPTFFGLQITSPQVWYCLLYGSLIATLCLALAIRRSPLGKAWLGIRENTERSYFIGLDVFKLKLLSYLISAVLAAFAGAMYVLFNSAVSPETLHWYESGKILMYVVLGGVGTIVGPAVGALIFTLAERYISSISNAWPIYFGALFIVIVIVAPGGIFGLLRSLWSRIDSFRARCAT